MSKGKLKITRLDKDTYKYLTDFIVIHRLPQSWLINKIIMDTSVKCNPRPWSEVYYSKHKYSFKIGITLYPESIECLKKIKNDVTARDYKISENEIIREKIKNAKLEKYIKYKNL